MLNNQLLNYVWDHNAATALCNFGGAAQFFSLRSILH